MRGDAPVPKKAARPRPWDITTRADGRIDITVRADSVERAAELARHAKRSIGAEAKTAVEVTATSVRAFVPPAPFSLAFGGPIQFRAIAKSSVNALALCKTPTIVLDAAFDPVREYILNGVDHADELATGADPGPNLCCFDFRAELFPPLPQDVPSGPLDHRLVIRGAAATGVAYATMALFGQLPFSVLLTSHWAGDDFCWALIADPVPGGTGFRTVDLQTDIRPAVTGDAILSHAIDQTALLARCDALFGHLQRLVEDRVNSSLIHDALRTVLGKPDGRPVTQEMMGRLAQEVAERFVRQQYRIDHKTSIDPPEII